MVYKESDSSSAYQDRIMSDLSDWDFDTPLKISGKEDPLIQVHGQKNSNAQFGALAASSIRLCNNGLQLNKKTGNSHVITLCFEGNQVFFFFFCALHG